MNRVNGFIKSAYPQERIQKVVRSKDLIVLLSILGTLLAGLVVANLIASGNLLIATTFVFAIPAFILLLRFPFTTLIIWLVLSPFLVQTPSSAERQVYWLVHRLLPVLTLGILTISSGLRISKRHLHRLGLAEYAMIGYVAFSVLSIILQSNAIVTTLIRFYDSVFIPICLYIVVKLSAPGEKSLKLLVLVSLYIIITQVVIGILSWVMPSILPSYWLTYAGVRTTGSLNSVSVFTTTLIFAGVFVLYAALRMKPGWKRNLLIIVYLSTYYSIFISFSRACWLAGILVILGVFILFPRFTFRLTLRLFPIILLLGGTLLLTQLQFAKDRLYSEGSTQSALSRLPVMLAAYRMFEQKPIFGWGYGNFNRFDRQFQSRVGDLVNPDEKNLTSHNMYLTVLAEQGLVGLTLVLMPVICLLLSTIKIRSRFPRSGFKSGNMIGLLWLVILSYIIVFNFAPMVVVFGLGLYWISLGFISNILQTYS